MVDTEGLFSRNAWMAFIAHLAVAVVVIAPAVYAGAQHIARAEAEKAVNTATVSAQEAIEDVKDEAQAHNLQAERELGAIRSKQAEFGVDIDSVKRRLTRIEETTVRTDQKIDRLIERDLQ